MDNMLQMMEKYANNLEELVDEKTQQYMEEKKKSDLLLYSMMPVLVFNYLFALFLKKTENRPFLLVIIYKNRVCVIVYYSKLSM